MMQDSSFFLLLITRTQSHINKWCIKSEKQNWHITDEASAMCVIKKTKWWTDLEMLFNRLLKTASWWYRLLGLMPTSKLFKIFFFSFWEINHEAFSKVKILNFFDFKIGALSKCCNNLLYCFVLVMTLTLALDLLTLTSYLCILSIAVDH